MLGTQPYPTHRSVSTHCVPNPNLIKGSSNMLFYTHRHSNMHLSFNTAYQPTYIMAYDPTNHLTIHALSLRAASKIYSNISQNIPKAEINQSSHAFLNTNHSSCLSIISNQLLFKQLNACLYDLCMSKLLIQDI